jgi:hypothetical protein
MTMNLPEADVIEKVRAFFVLSDLRRSDWGHLRPEAADHGIHTLDQWDAAMDGGTDWLRANRRAVLACLPTLKAEWPRACEAVRVLLAGQG